MAVAARAAFGPAGHALPPICRTSDDRLQERLHLREPRRDEAPQGCSRTRNMRGKRKGKSNQSLLLDLLLLL